MRLEHSLDVALSRIPKVSSGADDEADVPNPISQTISEPTDLEGDRESADVPGLKGKEKSPDELVAEVMRILREKETFHRPLRYDRPRIKNHQPNTVLAEKFEKHVNDELKRLSLNTFTTKKWLRISTWWLLKVPIHSVTLSLRAALMRKLRQSTPDRNAKDSKKRMLPSVYPSTANRRQTKLMLIP